MFIYILVYERSIIVSLFLSQIRIIDFWKQWFLGWYSRILRRYKRNRNLRAKFLKVRHIVLHWLSDDRSHALASSIAWEMSRCRVNNENGQAWQRRFLSRRGEQCGVASVTKKICGESVHSIGEEDGDDLSSRFTSSILYAKYVNNLRLHCYFV